MYKHCPYLASQKLKSELEHLQISGAPEVRNDELEIQKKDSVFENCSKMRDVLSKTIEVSSSAVVSEKYSELHKELTRINESAIENSSKANGGSNQNSPKRRYFTKVSSDQNFSKVSQGSVKAKTKHGLFDPVRRWNSFHSRERKNSQQQQATINLHDKLCSARDSLVSVVTQTKFDANRKMRCKSESSEMEIKTPKKTRCKSASNYPHSVHDSPRVPLSLNVSEENLASVDALRERTYSDNCILSSKAKEAVEKRFVKRDLTNSKNTENIVTADVDSIKHLKESSQNQYQSLGILSDETKTNLNVKSIKDVKSIFCDLNVFEESTTVAKQQNIKTSSVTENNVQIGYKLDNTKKSVKYSPEKPDIKCFKSEIFQEITKETDQKVTKTFNINTFETCFNISHENSDIFLKGRTIEDRHTVTLTEDHRGRSKTDAKLIKNITETKDSTKMLVNSNQQYIDGKGQCDSTEGVSSRDKSPIVKCDHKNTIDIDFKSESVQDRTAGDLVLRAVPCKVIESEVASPGDEAADDTGSRYSALESGLGDAAVVRVSSLSYQPTQYDVTDATCLPETTSYLINSQNSEGERLISSKMCVNVLAVPDCSTKMIESAKDYDRTDDMQEFKSTKLGIHLTSIKSDMNGGGNNNADVKEFDYCKKKSEKYSVISQCEVKPLDKLNSIIEKRLEQINDGAKVSEVSPVKANLPENRRGVMDVLNFIDKNMIYKSDEPDQSLLGTISKSVSVKSDASESSDFQINDQLVKNKRDSIIDSSDSGMSVNSEQLVKPKKSPVKITECSPAVSSNKFEKLSAKFACKAPGAKNYRDYLDSYINEKPRLGLYGKGFGRSVSVDRTMSLNRSDPCLHSPEDPEDPSASPATRPRRTRRPPAAPLPRRRFSVCFGKRTGGSARRPNECFVLEPSEMIVIDYPDTDTSRVSRPHLMDHQHTHQHRPMNLYDEAGMGRVYQKCNRGSHSSDTSSAYSGSDTMASTHSELGDELDLTGLVESIVDSDEDDDLAESMDSLTVRDTVRECLEKDPSERTEDDIETLLEFTQHLKAFTNMTLAVRRALCQVMVFAVVEKAGTVVMNDGEELDSWSVLVNGSVEVTVTGEPPRALSLGDAFGILPTMDKLYHRGVMRTKCDDCQFVCITQTDYYRIQHDGESNIRRQEENGQVVLVTELRGTMESGARRGHVVIRGSPERLMLQLIEENSLTDPTYVEDFLLTHRTFISSPLHVANMLLQWFKEPAIRDRVTRVVLLWVNNHFTDFETDPSMIEFLETFEQHLENEKMTGQLRLLNIACAAKARVRNVVLARPSRDEVLNFQILGGYDRNFGIFISKVDKKSKAEDIGLKRGDQILEVNGQSFEHVSHAKALDILRGTTHLSITVKSNLLNFKEMLNTPDNSPRPRSRRAAEISRLQADPRARLSSVDTLIIDSPCSRPVALHSPHKEKTGAKSFMTLGPKRRLQRALIKMNILPKTILNDSHSSSTDMLQDPLSVAPMPGPLYQSQSNPDLMSTYLDELHTDYPEHVLKIYKPDQSCKYLLVHKETTAHEVVMLALREFGMTEANSTNYSLCEVSVSEGGAIKQRQLPDQLQNLAERIGLSSRYYLKTKGVTETLVPDELASELARESAVHFLQLNAIEVAIQLTLQDFSIFRQIESTEYIDDLFELKSRYGTPMLGQFSELVNREMFWVVTEVCSESHVVRRSKIIKQFIKVARQCKECKNFNSMFAIISGLGHGAVSRLRQSWERLPGKYQRAFQDLQQLMDPSRNMSKYRQLVSAEQTQPPIIPFYPVVKKDLTFIHLGNDSKVEGLVNFEKLRMIAKEVRALTNMCSSPYDLLTMLELGGQPPSSAMVALNQLTTAAGAHHSGQATVKRRKKSTAAPNPKKMFEESQMVRRVKTYLNNMKVINDETKLHALSLECEGSGGGGHGSGSIGSGSGQPVRRRHASPAPSTASSTSTTSDERKPPGPKFGAASPQAVRKLLSLSEPGKTRPRQGAGGPGVHVPLPAGLLAPTATGRRPPSASGAYAGHSHPVGAGGRAMHERSHSDTPTPLPSVALSAESSSVTSLSNLPLRKTLTSGSVASSDSGHSTGADTHSNSSAEPPSHAHYVTPTAVVPPVLLLPGMTYPLVGAVAVLPPLPHSFRLGANRRQPPAYCVAAHMARLHRLGRAHSHEGCHYHTDPDTDQDDEDTQVSAV